MGGGKTEGKGREAGGGGETGCRQGRRHQDPGRWKIVMS